MPKLFEAFLARWLEGALPQALRLDVQYNAKLQANAELRFIVDLVIRDRATDRALCVLDTKYKAADVPSEDDIQQVVAYAVEMGVTRAFLVYPSSSTATIRAMVGNIEVRSATFDLGKDIDTAAKDFIHAVLPGGTMDDEISAA
jgi:5-methylcytosine-specific restriction enzyme subunit McrC